MAQQQPVQTEDELVYNLRLAVVRQLRRDREELEWAIEGNFDRYVETMARSGVWGGEPEMLMASKVINHPIGVYVVSHRNLQMYTRIQLYGENLKNETIPTSELSLLYDGATHYETLIFIPSSKL